VTMITSTWKQYFEIQATVTQQQTTKITTSKWQFWTGPSELRERPFWLINAFITSLLWILMEFHFWMLI
jgi:hypothetical protein